MLWFRSHLRLKKPTV